MKHRLVLALSLSVMLICGICSAQTAAPLKGKVTDPSGNPVAGVKVKVLLLTADGVHNSGYRAEPLGEVVTGPGGSYQIEHAKSFDLSQLGVVVIHVVHEPGKWLGFGCCEEPADLQKETVITVSKPRVYEGRVRDTSGKPMAGVRVIPVCLMMSGDDRTYYPIEELKTVAAIEDAVTDDNGIYRISNVPEAMDVYSKVQKAGYARIVGSYDEERSRDFVMGPGGCVTGRVVDENGKGVPGVPVSSYCTDGPSAGSAGVTGEDGKFEIDGLIPANHRLTLGDCRKGFHLDSGDLTITAGNEAKLEDIVMPSGAMVMGKVLDADTGEPIQGAEVRASGENWHTAPVKADKDGRFIIRAIPGKVHVCYSGGNQFYYSNSSEQSDPVEVSKSGLSDVVIQVSKMEVGSGIVLDAQGKPVPGAAVYLGIGDSDSSVTTDAEGKFTIPVPPASSAYG